MPAERRVLGALGVTRFRPWSPKEIVAAFRNRDRRSFLPDIEPPGGVSDWEFDPFRFPEPPVAGSREDVALTHWFGHLDWLAQRVRKLGQDEQLIPRGRRSRAERESDAERQAGSPGDADAQASASSGRARPTRRPPRAPTLAPDWRPGSPTVAEDAWESGLRARLPGAPPPALDLYAPDPETATRLMGALGPTYNVRIYTTLGDLVVRWLELREKAGHTSDEALPEWSLEASTVGRPPRAAVPLIYAPDGREFRRPESWDDPVRGAPVERALNRLVLLSAGRGGTRFMHEVLSRVLLDRPAVVFRATREAGDGVPYGVAGLPVRPVFDASAVRDLGSPAYLASVRAAVARAAADDIAHRAWQAVVEWIDAFYEAEPGLLFRDINAREGFPLDSWPPVPRRAADALRRVFLRPEGYPGIAGSAAAVGMDYWKVKGWWSAERFGLTSPGVLRLVLLAFHASWALWQGRATPAQTAAALGLTAEELDALLRGCTGMPPEDVGAWGIEIGPDALLDALLAKRPSEHGVEAATFWTWRLGEPPANPRARTLVPHLAPDAGPLPRPYDKLPRFTANVLPVHAGVIGGHPYAYGNPDSPYRRGATGPPTP